MKNRVIAALALASANWAYASCTGSAGVYTCMDYAGNSYQVQQLGNSTYLQGHNAGTGSSWTQNSQTYGNTTYIQGNSNGRSWNETVTTSPGMTSYSGTDTHGRSFHRTCTAYGCN